MTKEKLIWAEELIEGAGVDRKTAYSFHPLPFAHVIDGELYYELEPLGHWCRGCVATSRDEASHNWRLMRDTTARGWEEAMHRAEVQRAVATAVVRKGRRRKRKPRASTKIGSPLYCGAPGAIQPRTGLTGNNERIGKSRWRAEGS